MHGTVNGEAGANVQRAFIFTADGPVTIKGNPAGLERYLTLDIRGTYGCDDSSIGSKFNANKFSPDKGTLSGNFTLIEVIFDPDPDPDEEIGHQNVTVTTKQLSDFSLVYKLAGKQSRVNLAGGSEDGDVVGGTFKLPTILDCNLASGAISSVKSNSLFLELQGGPRYQVTGPIGNLFEWVELG